MANISAPFGFRYARQLTGTAPNCAQVTRQIAYNNTTPIYRGDPVTSLSTGYIAQSVAGTTTIAGIFLGCKYISVSQGRTVWMPWWPGTDVATNGIVEAYINNDPDAVWMVQSANGGPVTLSDVGTNVNFGLGTGNQSNGISGAYADFATINSTSTLPFRIVALAGDDPWFSSIGNGGDNTTEYNNVYVAFNNQDFKTTTGLA